MFAVKPSPLLDIYAMLFHVVRAFPMVTDGAGKEIVSRRPDTFAALMDLDDINADGLNKDSRYADLSKHLFFSRQWSLNPNRQQTSSIGFSYPLIAVQPSSLGVSVKDKYTSIRISLMALDQHPGKTTETRRAYDAHRTFEELESDLSVMFTRVIREWLGSWALYQVTSSEDQAWQDGSGLNWVTGDGDSWSVPATIEAGSLWWSPTRVDNARVIYKMSDAFRDDEVEANFYRNSGVDQVAGVQGFLTVRMPRTDCYLPSDNGGIVTFDYDLNVAPRHPNGLPKAA